VQLRGRQSRRLVLAGKPEAEIELVQPPHKASIVSLEAGGGPGRTCKTGGG
jgi:hypothetical protein